jgi:hypothetical protein
MEECSTIMKKIGSPKPASEMASYSMDLSPIALDDLNIIELPSDGFP